MSIFQRAKNLWKISGIELTGPSPKADALTELTKVFFKEPEKAIAPRMATIFSFGNSSHSGPWTNRTSLISDLKEDVAPIE